MIKGIKPFIFANFPANLNMKSLSLTYKNKVYKKTRHSFWEVWKRFSMASPMEDCSRNRGWFSLSMCLFWWWVSYKL